MNGKMDTLKLISGYATTSLPFLAAILSGMNAYEARGKRWRCIFGGVSTAFFVGIGLLNVFR